jgi:hypothetical protein
MLEIIVSHPVFYLLLVYTAAIVIVNVHLSWQRRASRHPGKASGLHQRLPKSDVAPHHRWC